MCDACMLVRLLLPRQVSLVCPLALLPSARIVSVQVHPFLCAGMSRFPDCATSWIDPEASYFCVSTDDSLLADAERIRHCVHGAHLLSEAQLRIHIEFLVILVGSPNQANLPRLSMAG